MNQELEDFDNNQQVLLDNQYGVSADIYQQKEYQLGVDGESFSN